MPWQWVAKTGSVFGQRGASAKKNKQQPVMHSAAKLHSNKKQGKVMQVKKAIVKRPQLVKKTIAKPAPVKTGSAGNAPDRAARQRVSAARVTGKLLKWNGTTGWIKPSQPIKHKDAEKRGGTIFVHTDDVQNGHKVVQGAAVSFFAYSDGKGIGAEHVMAVSAGEAAAPTKFKAAAQAVAGKLKAGKPSVHLAGQAGKMLAKQGISAAAGTKYGCEVCQKQFVAFALAASCEKNCKAKKSAVTNAPSKSPGLVKSQGNTYGCEICKKAFPIFALAANCEKACKAKKAGVKSSAVKIPGAVVGKPLAGATVYRCDFCHKSFPTFTGASTCEKGCKLKKAKVKPGVLPVAVKQTAFKKGKMQNKLLRRF